MKEQLRDNPPRFTGLSKGDSFQNQGQLLSDHFFDLPLYFKEQQRIYTVTMTSTDIANLTMANILTNLKEIKEANNVTVHTGDVEKANNSLSNTFYLDYDFPDLEMDFKSQVSLIILYSVTTALSVCGNALVLVVLTCGNRSKTDLTKFLLNMAVADLFMACFCIPFSFTNTMLGHWIFGEAMCPIVLFIQVTSVAVSIFTNMAIGIDR